MRQAWPVEAGAGAAVSLGRWPWKGQTPPPQQTPPSGSRAAEMSLQLPRPGSACSCISVSPPVPSTEGKTCAPTPSPILGPTCAAPSAGSVTGTRTVLTALTRVLCRLLWRAGPQGVGRRCGHRPAVQKGKPSHGEGRGHSGSSGRALSSVQVPDVLSSALPALLLTTGRSGVTLSSRSGGH